MKLLVTEINNNNNNQSFYSQASWGRLEMKTHERKRREKQMTIKKPNKKGENKGR
jgi:hypothetical protein